MELGDVLDYVDKSTACRAPRTWRKAARRYLLIVNEFCQVRAFLFSITVIMVIAVVLVVGLVAKALVQVDLVDDTAQYWIWRTLVQNVHISLSIFLDRIYWIIWIFFVALSSFRMKLRESNPPSAEVKAYLLAVSCQLSVAGPGEFVSLLLMCPGLILK